MFARPAASPRHNFAVPCPKSDAAKVPVYLAVIPSAAIEDSDPVGRNLSLVFAFMR